MVSDCVPWGPEFPEGMLGLANLGIREARQLDSGPPDLASARTVPLYCLNLGMFHKSHLKRDDTDAQCILWENRERESSVLKQN